MIRWLSKKFYNFKFLTRRRLYLLCSYTCISIFSSKGARCVELVVGEWVRERFCRASTCEVHWSLDLDLLGYSWCDRGAVIVMGKMGSGNRVPVHWTPLPRLFDGCLWLFWQLALHLRFYDAARILNCSFACWCSCITEIGVIDIWHSVLYSALYLPFILGASVRWVRSCAKSIKMITTIPKKTLCHVPRVKCACVGVDGVDCISLH